MRYELRLGTNPIGHANSRKRAYASAVQVVAQRVDAVTVYVWCLDKDRITDKVVSMFNKYGYRVVTGHHYNVIKARGQA